MTSPSAAPAARNRGGRPARISRERILEVATELDLEDLTMSAVAQRLGVTHASLYKYFPSRAALVAAVMLDRGERMAVPDARGVPWGDWVVSAGFRCRDHVASHLAATGLLRSSGLDAVLGPLMQTFIEVLTGAGFSSLATADAWAMFRGCCLGSAFDVRRIETITSDPSVLEVWTEVTESFTRGASPATVRFMADVAEHLDVDAGFRRQLETLVRAWQPDVSA